MVTENILDEKSLNHFSLKCKLAFQQLFELAKNKDEVMYALSLSPEFRGCDDNGWNTASEASQALEDYMQLLEITPEGTSIKVRVALSLYCHLAEAAGFYEVIKNMMQVATGGEFTLWSFANLNTKHRLTGEEISPNATKVIKDLLGHASELQLDEFKSILLETFDFDLRNGYAHADYVIWSDGVRLPRRNVGPKSNRGERKIVSFRDLTIKVNKAVLFFTTLQDCIAEAMKEYSIPRKTSGRLNSKSPVMPAIISCSEEGFKIQSGYGLDKLKPDTK